MLVTEKEKKIIEEFAIRWMSYLQQNSKVEILDRYWKNDYYIIRCGGIPTRLYRFTILRRGCTRNGDIPIRVISFKENCYYLDEIHTINDGHTQEGLWTVGGV